MEISFSGDPVVVETKTAVVDGASSKTLFKVGTFHPLFQYRSQAFNTFDYRRVLLGVKFMQIKAMPLIWFLVADCYCS